MPLSECPRRIGCVSKGSAVSAGDSLEQSKHIDDSNLKGDIMYDEETYDDRAFYAMLLKVSAVINLRL